MDLVNPGATRPSPRMWNQLVYASASDVTILYGGNVGTSQSAVGVNDTWTYNFGTNQWTNVQPPTHPNATSLYAAAYDSRRNRVVIYGGGSYTETWAYDVVANTWTNLMTTGAPMAGQNPGMVYDCHSDQFILVDDNDVTWTYDPQATGWQQRTPTPSTPAVHHFSLVYLPNADRTVLYPNHFGNETWDYDDGIVPVACTDPPGPRDGGVDGLPIGGDAGGPGLGGGPGGCGCRSTGNGPGGKLLLGLLVVAARRRRCAR